MSQRASPNKDERTERTRREWSYSLSNLFFLPFFSLYPFHLILCFPTRPLEGRRSALLFYPRVSHRSAFARRTTHYIHYGPASRKKRRREITRPRVPRNKNTTGTNCARAVKGHENHRCTAKGMQRRHHATSWSSRGASYRQRLSLSVFYFAFFVSSLSLLCVHAVVTLQTVVLCVSWVCIRKNDAAYVSFRHPIHQPTRVKK